MIMTTTILTSAIDNQLARKSRKASIYSVIVNGEDGKLYGFVTLNEEDCIKIYQAMV